MTDPSTRIAELEHALRIGIEMRNAQKAYFKDRTQHQLMASKVAEKAFDTAAKSALETDNDRLI